MLKEFAILKRVKEDVLRILGEGENKKFSLRFIESRIKVSNLFISQAMEQLIKENLVQSPENFILLTPEGEKEAKRIIKNHLAIENYFKKTRSEKKADKAADILEHYVSKEVIDIIKKLSTFKKEGIPLTKLELNKKGIITDIIFSDCGLFERMVSMGICLGEKISIIYNIPDGFVINVSRKKIALGKDIAKKIEVLK